MADSDSRQVTSQIRPQRQRRGYWHHLRHQKEEVLNVRAEAVKRRSRLERLIERAAQTLAHPLFFLWELLFHAAWIVLNVGVVPGVPIWDPYPFPLLMGFASVQALFIGLLILMHARRNEWINEVRDETDLQVALHTERETTKLLRMMVEIQEALGIESREQDGDLIEMAQPLDPARLHHAMAEQLKECEGEK